MNPAAVERNYTPEDLLVMPDGDSFELVGGELVARNMGWSQSSGTGLTDWICPVELHQRSMPIARVPPIKPRAAWPTDPEALAQDWPSNAPRTNQDVEPSHGRCH